MNDMYTKIVTGVIAVSLSILAFKNLDIVGNANAVVGTPATVQPMDISNNMLGEIRIFAGDYAPEGWMFCEGQTLKVEDFEELHSVIEYKYGGDEDEETFKIPDMRGRFPLGAGQGDNTDYARIASDMDILFRKNNNRGSNSSKPASRGQIGDAPVKKSKAPANSTSNSPLTKSPSLNNNSKYLYNGGSLALRYIICTEGALILPDFED